MSFKIGFTAETNRENTNATISTTVTATAAPRKSVVQVHFPARGLTCAYYNDTFDLHKGDIVYVDGKLEGLRGRVVDVSYNFKIKLSDYKRVIGKADTDVKGDFIWLDLTLFHLILPLCLLKKLLHGLRHRQRKMTSL